MTPVILVLNMGSSSIKFALYGEEDLDVLCEGTIDRISLAPECRVRGALADGFDSLTGLPQSASHEELIERLLSSLDTRRMQVEIVAVGHRVVHGGLAYSAPTGITPTVLAELESLVSFAPLHEPHNIAGIRAVMRRWPGVEQVACFDTAFHHGQPRLAKLMALPRKLTNRRIVRYGFHGLSYEHITSVLPQYTSDRANGKVIVAHLGHGASMCALRERRSVDSTMGFTTLDGLMMGKRCGAIDPGVVLHLMQQLHMSPERVGQLLNQESGLLGVSEISDDVRVLEASSDARAEEALDLFAYQARKAIGSLASVLGGLDVLVFTAGVGENSSDMRQRICNGLQWLGIEIDAQSNVKHASCISTPDCTVDVLIIPCDEAMSIARGTRTLLSISSKKPTVTTSS